MKYLATFVAYFLTILLVFSDTGTLRAFYVTYLCESLCLNYFIWNTYVWYRKIDDYNIYRSIRGDLIFLYKLINGCFILDFSTFLLYPLMFIPEEIH